MGRWARGRGPGREVYGALEERLTAKALRRMQYWPNIQVGSEPGRYFRNLRPTMTTSVDSRPPKVSSTEPDRSETHSYLSAAGELSLGHLDVAGHSDKLIALERFLE
jgi:hypothetical protein